MGDIQLISRAGFVSAWRRPTKPQASPRSENQFFQHQARAALWVESVLEEFGEFGQVEIEGPRGDWTFCVPLGGSGQIPLRGTRKRRCMRAADNYMYAV